MFMRINVIMFLKIECLSTFLLVRHRDIVKRKNLTTSYEIINHLSGTSWSLFKSLSYTE
jgi:hypothetical protein